jgi:predicted TPR repeat methyltransferase
VLYLMKDHAAAVEAYRRAVEHARTPALSAKFRSELGLMLEAKGDLDDAIKQHQEAVRIDQSKTPVYQQRLAAARKEKADRTAPPPREARR